MKIKNIPFDIILQILIPLLMFALGIVINYLVTNNSLVPSLEISIILFAIIETLVLLIILYIFYKLWKKRESEEREFNRVSSFLDKHLQLNNVNVYSSDLSFTDRIFSNVEEIEKYYNEVISTINSAQKSIQIYNYIDNHPKLTAVLKQLKKEDQASYKRVHDTISSYYKALEEKLSKEEISYSRYIMLPISHSSAQNNFTPNNYEVKEKTKLEDHLNEFSISHIKEILKISKSQKHRINIEVLSFSMLNYSFGIIDDKKILLELDKYSVLGHSLPNNILHITDQENGHIVTSFRNMVKPYLKHAFPLDPDRDFKRTIGDIKNKEVELRPRILEKSD
jgi:hypothetical protein